jgi:hypothetical protein
VPAESVRLTGLVALVTIPYFLLPRLLPDAPAVRAAFWLWLALAAAQALAGIGIMALYRQGIDLGVQLTLGSPPVPVGTMREANILGSYTAAGAAACLALLCSRVRSRRLL